MDSPSTDRYAEIMQSRAFFLFAVTVLLSSVNLPLRAEDAPVLAVLEYSGGLFPKRADIRKTGGKVKSPYPNLRQAAWTLRPGETIKQEFAPRERTIQFLKLTGHTPQLLCSVLVRYTRSEKGWHPTYLLLKQAPIACTEVPATKTAGQSDPVTGGYSRLSFGLASRLGQIDGWTVH